jgi:hypothetical protein
MFTTSGPTITLPTITTNPVTAYTQTTATSGGNVTSDGGASVKARGVGWSASQNWLFPRDAGSGNFYGVAFFIATNSQH